MTEREHRASVVIPAYNEGQVIDRCLDALLESDQGLLVVVAANGCADDTAVRARAHGVDVVEITQASKIAALNAADERCGEVFPRIYLDADIVLRSHDARAVVDFLNATTQPIVCSPRMVINDSRSSRIVRAFFRIFTQLPYSKQGRVGGCFATNAPGRARWQQFPIMTADDLFVQGRFAASERYVLDTSSFVVTVPRTLRGLLRVRTRTYRGNAEAARLDRAGSMANSRGNSLSALRKLCRERPGLIGPALIYVVVNIVAALRARALRSRSVWLTDSTSRAGA